MMAVALQTSMAASPVYTSEDKLWWKNTVVYQIYPRSYQDANSDGTGDIKGIESRVDYFIDIGIGTIWFSPIFKSPMKDFGYDISNYTDIDPLFGTLEDFDSLISKLHEKNIKVVLDLVPNHSSDKHEWFIKSQQRIDPYTDYYVWYDGIQCDNTTAPPNNWVSVFGGSMWQCDPVRKQFYLHQFLKEQPDLNFENPLVRQEMKDMLSFWLDRGVDGFRIDAIPHLFEDSRFLNESESEDNEGLKPDQYGYYKNDYSKNDPRIFDVLAEWRELMDSYEEKDGHHRILMAEAYASVPETMKYYGTKDKPLCDFPFNFQLIGINENTTGQGLHTMVTNWLDNMPDFGWPNWVLGNHDQSRVGSRGHPELRNGYNMLSTLLGGTTITYYGEEIGMLDGYIPFEDSVDPQGLFYGKDGYLKHSRDLERTPMQWDNTPNAGFSEANKTWLPINSNYKNGINVKDEKKDPGSFLQVYRRLLQLRQNQVFKTGTISFPFVTQTVFSFVRYVKGIPVMYAVFLNLADEIVLMDLNDVSCCGELDFKFPEGGTVVLHSAGRHCATRMHPGTMINLKQFTLNPYDALIVSFSPVA